MTDPRTQRMFRWLDWAFWLIWLGFPVLIWSLVRSVLDLPAQLARLAPDQAQCLVGLPQVALFSAVGKVAFWVPFAVEMAVYAVLLFLAHRVVHWCATGQIFIPPIIRALQMIGVIIAAFPLCDWVMQMLAAWIYVQTGDMPFFDWGFAVDVPVIGVGLLLVTMAAAMRMAVQLHEDAALTI